MFPFSGPPPIIVNRALVFLFFCKKSLNAKTAIWTALILTNLPTNNISMPFFFELIFSTKSDEIVDKNLNLLWDRSYYAY